MCDEMTECMEGNDRIRERIEARIEAREWFSSFLDGESEVWQIAFIKELDECCHSTLSQLEPKPIETGLRVMTDEQAKRFEQKPIEFGIFKDTPYGKARISYLTFVADSALELQAYLRSDIGKARIEKDV